MRNKSMHNSDHHPCSELCQSKSLRCWLIHWLILSDIFDCTSFSYIVCNCKARRNYCVSITTVEVLRVYDYDLCSYTELPVMFKWLSYSVYEGTTPKYIVAKCWMVLLLLRSLSHPPSYYRGPIWKVSCVWWVSSTDANFFWVTNLW